MLSIEKLNIYYCISSFAWDCKLGTFRGNCEFLIVGLKTCDFCFIPFNLKCSLKSTLLLFVFVLSEHCGITTILAHSSDLADE